MGSPDDSREVARLQALAYGRDVPEDARADALARLAAIAPVAAAHSEPSIPAIPDPPPDPALPRRRWLRAGVAVVAAVVIAAIVIVVLVTRPRDSLEVFDRAPTAADRAAQEILSDRFGPSAGLDASSVRVLSTDGTMAAVVARMGDSVCMFSLENVSTSGGPCPTVEEFRQDGITMQSRGRPEADGTRVETVFEWGPTGDLRSTERVMPSPPPPPPPLAIFNREQVASDLAALESLSLTEEEAATLRLIDARDEVLISVYRPTAREACLVVGGRLITGEVVETCGTDDDVNSTGLTVNWEPERWGITWGPGPGFRIVAR